MRQASAYTNLLLAIGFAILSVLALGSPWYAVAEPPSGSGEGAMEAIASDLYEFFTAPGVTGTEALADGRQPLIVLAAVTGVLALLMLAGVARRLVREPLRWVPMAAPVLILVKAVQHPAPGHELRYGILLSFAAAAFAASAAYQGATVPAPKAKPQAYVPPPPPPSFGSTAPPGT